MSVKFDVIQLIKDSVATSVSYYIDIEERLTETKGKKWCDEHPEVISRICIASSIDCLTTVMQRIIDDSSDDIKEGLKQVASAINSLDYAQCSSD